ncbi:MAG: hypothetical protein LBF04_04130 [Prevotellaceae bacterium]|jgi:hypothetical protein|nr:hypothetical protein [Prevotellaceae bacterium]
MIIYLAAFRSVECYYNKQTSDIYLLSSFFEHKSGKFGDYVYQDRHILDSGAFSTFKNPVRAKNLDWDTYVRNYIKFINHTDQKLFFELDIDCVIGLERVEYYRKKIEDATGRQPIPVWHFERKWDYFEMMCENYPYVAIGTVPVGKQGKLIRQQPLVLKKFIDTAHSKGKKIHGLGFTLTDYLKKLPFDSVDSTTWNSAGRFGSVYRFNNNGYMDMYVHPKDMRVSDYRHANLHNLEEWIKFQKYAEKNL